MTTQWPKEKVQKDKQRSTKHTYKTKDRVTRISLIYVWFMTLSTLYHEFSVRKKQDDVQVFGEVIHKENRS
jgi:hypothetical protein